MISAAALLLFAQASDAGAAKTPAEEPAAARATSGGSCPAPSATETTIVICTQRPQGYRLDPDVMEAKREIRSGGRPVRQSTEGPPPECATVGPFPCFTAGINLIAAAATAAEMAERLARGEEIGSMFRTDPHPDEYQLYRMAKARREADEAQKAAQAKAKAAKATQPQPATEAPATPPPQPAGP